uniref:VOC family protein n=1 Tax=Vaginimicrobium propionicum TaxID=1871034 RepID=UPI000970BD20|nr:VOC family protein [Vaginimicrobium propionicum]
MSILDSLNRRAHLHGLHHAGVTVSSFEEAVNWYHEMFGFHLVNELKVDGEKANELAGLYGQEGLEIRLGFLATQSSAMLEIFEFSPTQPELDHTVWNRPGYQHVAIAVRDVPRVKAELEAKGVQFVTDVQFMGGAHWAFMKDPDGNLIEIIDLHANRLPLKFFGNMVGRIMKRTVFSRLYW